MDNIWQDLLPDHIFKAVEQAINASLSNICLRRNSYINRVYELERLDNNERLIAKFYRPNRWSDKMIKEEHAFVAELAAEGLPVIAPQSLNGQTLFPCGQINFALESLRLEEKRLQLPRGSEGNIDIDLNRWVDVQTAPNPHPGNVLIPLNREISPGELAMDILEDFFRISPGKSVGQKLFQTFH